MSFYMDIGMSGLDGMETCRRLKAEEITRHIPIIMMTEFS
jgi:two-component system cell cycle response regulator